MYRVEVPLTINRIITIFEGLKVWDHNKGTFSWATILKLFQVINFVSFVTSNIISAAITTNMQEAVLLTDFSILTGTHAVRMVYIVWKKSEILHFIDEIGVMCTDDIDESVRVSNKMSAFLKIAEIFLFACSGQAVLVIVFPILSNESVLNIAFPWEKTGLAFYISHIFVSLGTVYCVIWFLFTVIIWYLMLSCSLQYHLLGNQLRSLGKTYTTVKELKSCNPKQLQQQLFAVDLIRAIEAHRKIYR